MFVKRILLAVVFFACGLFIFFDKTNRLNQAKDKVSHPILDKSIIGEEVFRFKKSFSVKFEFNEKVFNQQVKGILFLKWIEKKIAIVSVEIEGYASDLFLKAKFNDKFSLNCVELPEVSTESDFDVLILIKSLLLDYSFKTTKDENGEYEVSFQEKEKFNKDLEISKVKHRYIDSKKEGIKVVNSLHQILLAPFLFRARGREQLELSFQGSKNAFIKSDYELQAIKGESKPTLRENLNLGTCGDLDLNDFKISHSLQVNDFKSLLTGIERSPRSQRHDHLRKTLKALKARPELISSFLNWFSSVKEKKKLSAIALGVLGQLGTPEAQKALVNIFDGAGVKNTHLHRQVLNTFTLTTHPLTHESREFLRSIIHDTNSDLSPGAAYALGSSIQNNPQGRDERSDLDFLVSELENAENVEDKLVFLDALGNSKNKAILPSLNKYVHSSDKSVREKANHLVTNFN